MVSRIPIRLHRILFFFLLLFCYQSATAAEFRQLDDLSAVQLNAFHSEDQWLVVVLWESDCPICNHEAHAYQDFHFTHGDQIASVLGITLDGQERLEEARKFVRRHGLEYPNIIGEPLEVAHFYQTVTGTPWLGTPSLLLYRPGGKLVATHVGAIQVELIENFITTHQGL